MHRRLGVAHAKSVPRLLNFRSLADVVAPGIERNPNLLIAINGVPLSSRNPKHGRSTTVDRESAFKALYH